MVENTDDYRQALRAYELGRLRASTRRALATALPIAAAGWLWSGAASLAWIPITVAAWVIAYWRGGAVLRGAVYGLAGGVVTSLLPMSILRPCCVPGVAMGPDCCTAPGACLAAGGVVGVLLAAVVPVGKDAWWRSALGTVLGVASVAILKCATLFAGEALGLVAGLAAGLVAASAAKAFVGRRAAA